MGAKVKSRARDFALQLADVAVSRRMFADPDRPAAAAARPA
jgi:hypothetical protein